MMREPIKPEISIITPIYNTEPYVANCLESLRQQSLQNIEIICVDNGSTDNSVQLVRKLMDQDKRIVFISKPGGRQGHARNEGLKIARGEFVGFVDSDDKVDGDFFEKLLDSARRLEADISVGNMVLHNEKTASNGSFWITKVVDEFTAAGIDCVSETEDKVKLVHANSNCNKIFRTSFIRDHEILFPEGVAFEDNLFNLKSVLLAQKIAVRNDSMYYYVQREKANSTTDEAFKKDHVFDIFIVGTMMYEFLKSSGEHSALWDRAFFRYMVVNHYLALLWRQDQRGRDRFITHIRTALLKFSLCDVIRYASWSSRMPLFAIRMLPNGKFLNVFLFYRPREILRRIFGRR